MENQLISDWTIWHTVQLVAVSVKKGFNRDIHAFYQIIVETVTETVEAYNLTQSLTNSRLLCYISQFVNTLYF